MRKPDVDLRALDSLLTKVFGPRNGFRYRRTPTGASTQVYRLDRGNETFYVRIAEEHDASLGPEAELHRVLVAAGVRVPAIVHYEPYDDVLARSVMVTAEVPGHPVDATTSKRAAQEIGLAAGRDLARIHEVPVNGFGWISREHGRPDWPLRAEARTFSAYVNAPAATAPLTAIGFSGKQAQKAEALLEEAVFVGPSNGVGSVAHGDFDISHVYEANGAYAGMIDFGEIRGTDYTFDFATLHLTADDDPPAPQIHRYVERGYAELHPLPDDHEHRLYLACVLNACHRLSTWHARDGDRAADGWFFRWIRDRLRSLLETGRVPKL